MLQWSSSGEGRAAEPERKRSRSAIGTHGRWGRLSLTLGIEGIENLLCPPGLRSVSVAGSIISFGEQRYNAYLCKYFGDGTVKILYVGHSKADGLAAGSERHRRSKKTREEASYSY